MTEALRQLVERGVQTDVFLADEASAVLRVIGEHSEKINASSDGNRRLFRWMQLQAQNSALMALGRMFDKPSAKYQTRCFLGLLEQLGKSQADLPEIQNRVQLFSAMRFAGVNDSKIASMKNCPDPEITAEILTFFRSKIDAGETRRSLQRAKEFRDKHLAHNEHIPRIVAPTWEDVLELTDLAKKLIGVVGWAYLNVAYLINGKYILSSDAGMVAWRVRRLIGEIV